MARDEFANPVCCIKKLDAELVQSLLGHAYVTVNPPTQFAVLRASKDATALGQSEVA